MIKSLNSFWDDSKILQKKKSCKYPQQVVRVFKVNFVSLELKSLVKIKNN